MGEGGKAVHNNFEYVSIQFLETELVAELCTSKTEMEKIGGL